MKQVHLFFLLAALGLAGCFSKQDPPITSPNGVSFEGGVEQGGDYRFDLGYRLSFVLEGKGPWVIKMFHDSDKDKDLVFPVNPPYRTEQNLIIGEGYGRTAYESVATFPRTFSFLYRERDIAVAWDAVNQILWPKAPDDQAKGETQIASLPYGKGTMELLSVDYFPNTPGSPNAGAIHEMHFRVKLTWPYNQPSAGP